MTVEQALASYERLIGYLAADPDNSSLLADSAAAAAQADKLPEAVDLYRRLDGIAPLEGGLANMAAIIAMRAGDQDQAQRWFSRCFEAHGEDPSLRFNIAWSKALSKDFSGAAELLDGAVVAALPQAAMLSLQIDHQEGRFDEAGKKLESYLAMHPEYPPLQAAASVLAMDIDDPDLARAAAEKGGDHPDALTTLGTLDLGDRNLDLARSRFEQALATRQVSPRAEVGLGLVDLAAGNAAAAALRLDRGAQQFGDHLGSWLAAGWAHFIAGDLDAARQRFEVALAKDDTFGEAHGSLAVVDLLQGEKEAAERRMKVSRRLDPQSFSTALATVLWAQSQGNRGRAEAVLEVALNQQIMPDGSTLLDQLVKSMAV